MSVDFTALNENMDTKKKELILKYTEEVKDLQKYASPDERMMKWKDIFSKFLKLSPSEKDKNTIISTSESLLKLKFSSTSLQIFETVSSEIKIQEKPFSVSQFAKKMKKKYLADNGIVDYSVLDVVAAEIIQQAPSVQFLRGIDLFADIEIPEKKMRIRRQKDPEKEKTKPSNVVNAKSEMPHNEIAVVFNALQNSYDKNGQNPIIYWLLVIDPSSFSLSVENIFYVSFLIKEGLAKMFFDKKDVLMIEPVPKKTLKDKFREVDRNQTTISINMNTWEALIKHFHIKKALIKWNCQ